jgi:hypothetical protein
VKQVLHPRAIDACEFVGRGNLDFCQKIGRFVLGIRNASFHTTACHTELVNQVSMLCDIREVDPVFRTTPLFGFPADSTVGGRHEAEESEAV